MSLESPSQALPFAEVALSLPSQSPFQYAVPEKLRGLLCEGQRVHVSIRNRRMVGYVVGFTEIQAFDEIKPIESLIDTDPILSPALLSLARWMSERYFCSLGQAIDAMMPAPFKRGKFVMKSRSKKTSETAELVDPTDLFLSIDQRGAYQKALEAISNTRHEVFLLHGVTGSGKTEVYMHLIRELLLLGRGSIVLVPEISLTPQTVDRFYSRFGDRIAVIHSRLSQARRVEEWHRIKSGQAMIVVGARSAVFSPVKNLGMIVIDEEHDTSYKQSETPRYHAREVARKRALDANAVVVLGSATPAIESYYDTTQTQCTYLALSERIEKRPLPAVEIVDMRRPVKERRDAIFSPSLETAVREALAKKEQVMLLLNRRGFSTHVHCSSCGYVAKCENCRTSMAYHFDKSTLLCHSCDYRAAVSRLCPGCQKNYLHYFGVGTQKVYEESARLFSDARMGRMDTDSMARKDAHETILRAFKKHEIDILIGTQMIAKGHDFPRVSLIGVISADTALHIPDFRASERTFDLLTQVAGRAGRGDIPGRVIIQTHLPNHYSIQSAKDHNYLEFYEKEIVFRQELWMPPFSQLVRVIFSGIIEKEVIRQIYLFGKLLELKMGLSHGMSVLGPAPCLVSRERGSFYWNLFVKGQSVESVNPLLREAIGEFKKTRITITVDVDPQ